MKSKLLKAVAATALVATAFVFAGPQWAKADSHDRSIEICNEASSRISHVYATHRDRDDWGRDLLVGVILPGECRTIDPGYASSDGYCVYDWMAVTYDGRVARRRFDTCTTSTWTIYDS